LASCVRTPPPLGGRARCNKRLKPEGTVRW
jgi:hypothetical protein